MSEIRPDSPHVRGIALTLMQKFSETSSSDWGVRLGNMIAAAETQQELLNYDSDMIAVATCALMGYPTLDYFSKFAKSVKRSDRLWSCLIDTFSEQIGTVHAWLQQEGNTRGAHILNEMCDTYPELEIARDMAVRVRMLADAAEKTRQLIFQIQSELEAPALV